MLSKIVSVSLIGLSCLAIVSASPTPPFSFSNNPLGNKFPTPAANQLAAIETQAHGSLPSGGGSPSKLSPDTLTSLRFVAFNELFEVAYFFQLLNLVKAKAHGFWDDDQDMEFVIDTLEAIVAQEELHTLNANNALKAFDPAGPVLPCQYYFPVKSLDEALSLASTFTDVALDGDSELIAGVNSVIGQEGGQNGFFRVFGHKIPSALPFLTESTRDFAFSTLNQNFVVPGSCPNFNTINLKYSIFDKLTIETNPEDIKPRPQHIEFSFQIPKTGLAPEWKSDCSGLELVYISQQNAPAVAKLEKVDIDVHAGKVTFSAFFPFDATTFGNGLTVAAVALSSGDLTSVEGVSKATVFGPGLIEIN